MAAGDPYPTGDSLTVKVPPQFAADFLTEHLNKAMNKRPVLRMVLRDPETGEETDLGGWQVTGVGSVHRSAGYDNSMADLRAVFD